MSLRQKLIAVTASLCIGIVLALALGEVVLRLRQPAMMRLQNNRIVLPKNQLYIYTHAGLRGCDPRIVHHKNSLGFRGAEPPVDFDHAVSVVAVGGSTTECFYLSDGHSWPEIVYAQLNGIVPRLWINNAGLDGHSTFGHTLLIQDYLSKLRPKFALFLVGINDIGRDDLGGYDRSLLKSGRVNSKSVLEAVGEKSRVIAWLENIGRAYRAWTSGLGHRSLELEKLPTLTIPESAAAELLLRHQNTYIAPYQDRLRRMIATCREFNIQPILITQPALYGKGSDDVTGVNLETLGVHQDQNGRLAWRILELYNEATRAAAREAGVPLIDLARELPKSSRYFYDFYHFTNAGSAATAVIIARHLRPILARSPSTQSGPRGF